LGRLNLEQGELKRAKGELSRSHGLATVPEVAATASLTLASVYLLNRDDPGAAGSANTVLMERRELLQAAPFRTQAAFLTALTRFRAAVGPMSVRRAGRELVAASAKVDARSFFGDYGYLLVGEAFADLNLAEETVRLYQEGLSQPVSPTVRDELTFRLAMQYRQQGEYELAKESLLELSSSPSKSWAPKAAIELADLLLRSGELPECVQHCRWALGQQHQESDNIELLRRLGRVYEELGDHERASICFAGFLPTDDPILVEAKR
jgi:tetratricopeptide (TPR) repeat protein